MYRQLGSTEMLPYSTSDEEELWNISRRVLHVRFTVTVSKQNPFHG